MIAFTCTGHGDSRPCRGSVASGVVPTFADRDTDADRSSAALSPMDAPQVAVLKPLPNHDARIERASPGDGLSDVSDSVGDVVRLAVRHLRDALQVAQDQRAVMVQKV